MARARGSGLAAADPRVGQTLRFDGQDWEVTDHSSYWNDAGYRVIEWCCETADVEGYLLKEIKDGEPTRWFFTRKIPREAVTGLGDGRPASPPPALTYESRSYRHAETNEGTYEEEPGQRVPKTTWEYWDDGRQRNLAVELWPDGRVDCYHGAYIEPDQVTPAAGAEGDREEGSAAPGRNVAAAGLAGLTAAAAARAAKGGKPGGGGGNPFIAAMVFFPLVYVFPFFVGRPFDECLAVALPLALLGGWLFALRAPRAAGLAFLGMALGLYLFWRFPPLTSPYGLAAVLGGPAVLAACARGEAARKGRRPVLYAAAVAVALPAVLVGLHRYFWYAPGPHTLDQLGLALGPAALGGLAALLVASVMLMGETTDA
jgi:Domain of unknown function (DUF4178)